MLTVKVTFSFQMLLVSHHVTSFYHPIRIYCSTLWFVCPTGNEFSFIIYAFILFISWLMSALILTTGSLSRFCACPRLISKNWVVLPLFYTLEEVYEPVFLIPSWKIMSMHTFFRFVGKISMKHWTDFRVNLRK